MVVEFRTIIIMIPKKEKNVHAYITTLGVLFYCSFSIECFGVIEETARYHPAVFHARRFCVTLNVMVC